MADLETLRGKTTQLLTEGWKSGLLSEEEYSWRSGHVVRAQNADDLEALVTDLLQDSTASADQGHSSGLPPAAASGTPHLSVLGQQRVASGALARQAKALSVLGSLELDYRQFPFSGHQSLELVVVLGEAVVVLPAGVRLKSQIVPILGEASGASPPLTLPPNAPVLEVKAVAILGSVRFVYR
jgi:hypothetical protein